MNTTRWYPSTEKEISKKAFEPVRLKLSPVCSDLNMLPFRAFFLSKRSFNYLKRSRVKQFLLERFRITFTANEKSQFVPRDQVFSLPILFIISAKRSSFSQVLSIRISLYSICSFSISRNRHMNLPFSIT